MRFQFNGCCLGLVMALFVTGLTSGGAQAQESETEKRYLIAITTEINNVKALAQKAAATADEHERLQFDYAALLRDLDAMQTAIEQHVKAPSRSPRVLGGLTTQYTKPISNE